MPAQNLHVDYDEQQLCYHEPTLLGAAGNARQRTLLALSKRTHSFVWSLDCPHCGAMDGWDRMKMTNDLDSGIFIETEC